MHPGKADFVHREFHQLFREWEFAGFGAGWQVECWGIDERLEDARRKRRGRCAGRGPRAVLLSWVGKKTAAGGAQTRPAARGTQPRRASALRWRARGRENTQPVRRDCAPMVKFAKHLLSWVLRLVVLGLGTGRDELPLQAATTKTAVLQRMRRRRRRCGHGTAGRRGWSGVLERGARRGMPRSGRGFQRARASRSSTRCGRRA